MSSRGFKWFAILLLTVLMCLSVTYASDDDNQVEEPMAVDCRRQLNGCLDQAEDRVPGVLDMDGCCDGYKQCMYKIGRNRP